MEITRKQDEHEKLIQACYERWMEGLAEWTELYELMNTNGKSEKH